MSPGTRLYLLDTDHVSLLDRGGPEGARIRARLRSLPGDDVATTIVSYEEQIRGWMARIARAANFRDQITDYAQLHQQLRNYCAITVLDFDGQAVSVLARLRALRIRIGTMDLKIASIALAHDAVLLTRNVTDFSKVPDLKVDDWSA